MRTPRSQRRPQPLPSEIPRRHRRWRTAVLPATCCAATPEWGWQVSHLGQRFRAERLQGSRRPHRRQRRYNWLQVRIRRPPRACRPPKPEAASRTSACTVAVMRGGRSGRCRLNPRISHAEHLPRLRRRPGQLTSTRRIRRCITHLPPGSSPNARTGAPSARTGLGPARAGGAGSDQVREQARR